MPTGDPRGSVWRRWEPHIHAPGTLLNDQFKGPNAWEDYLSEIETSEPTIKALGITDYWTLSSYEKVRSFRDGGRLSKVGLIFPNVEMRYGIATEKGAPINVHLLICPDDTDHVAQAKRFLATLTFSYGGVPLQ